MKAKKYKHADLENKRVIFFQIGLVCALALAFTAFEWSSDKDPVKYAKGCQVDPGETEMMPIFRNKEPEPKKPVPMKLSDVIVITDDVEIEDVDIEFPDYEDVDIYDFKVKEEELEDDTPFIMVEEMPEFPGGQRALLAFVAENVKYPVVCVENNIQGKVYVSFVIDKTGDVIDVQVVRSPHESLSKEAVRVVESMPRWTPGKQRNKAVKVAFTIPVNFVLQH
ncbi:MAG: energy transducer TonB [Marinilabiliaceae bacterium]|nr:energy transducer TonB [Marinilabiliaceae bacterium]